MRILVTGAAGFIGSNLSERLIEEGHTVIGIDNLSYGNLYNLRNLLSKDTFHFTEADVTDYFSIEFIECDLVIHLASQKIPRYSNSYATLNDNYLMTQNVINKCLKNDIKLIFASTSDVYGKNPNVPFNEESDLVLGQPTVKRWAYATSKMYSEHLILANNAENGLKYTIMRFFGSYGINQNRTWWGGAQSVFIKNIIDNDPLTVHGDGLQTRTFSYVEDTVSGIVLCIGEKADNNTFNIAGNPNEEISMLGLAELIKDVMKSDNLIELVPYSTFGKYEDVMRRVPDINKIKTMLGYSPKWNLRDGLIKTIESYDL